MGWSIGWDNNWKRDVGYGVPATCDFPTCNESIDRGLAYVCGDEPYGGDFGCGLYFCDKHLEMHKPHNCDRHIQQCRRCSRRAPPYKPKPDCKEWIDFKMKDDSWADWRKENNLTP